MSENKIDYQNIIIDIRAILTNKDFCSDAMISEIGELLEPIIDKVKSEKDQYQDLIKDVYSILTNVELCSDSMVSEIESLVF